MNKSVENYFINGCGRCSLAGTPECKVHLWTKELIELRRIANDCGLTEECKWGVPCYTYQSKNILLIGAFKEFCSLSFFKGSLIQDTHQILSKPGDNSQATRFAKYTHYKDILKDEDALKEYIFQAIEIEKAGLKVSFKPVSEYEMPDELTQKFKELPEFKQAFEALTPGRQKGYLLHFAQAKQSKTRESRIEKCMPQIFKGKGLNDY